MSSRRSAARCGLASSKIVRRMSLIVSSSWSTAALIRSATRPCAGDPGGVLQRQPDREQPLDDQVVQVAADPVAVLEHRQPGPIVLGQGDLQHQRHLLGEALRGLHDRSRAPGRADPGASAARAPRRSARWRPPGPAGSPAGQRGDRDTGAAAPPADRADRPGVGSIGSAGRCRRPAARGRRRPAAAAPRRRHRRRHARVRRSRRPAGR